jgi:hypothetical protein
MRSILAITFCLFISAARCQNPINEPNNPVSKYIGKYAVEGMIVQVALNNNSLILMVPGAPLQQMIPVGANKFKTDTFSDEVFLFVEKNGKIEQMISQRPGQSLELKRISSTPDDFNQGDSLLPLRKATDHFAFLYSKTDSIDIDLIAKRLEGNYRKMLNDFKIEKLPVTVVRIYPDLVSFHQGINFPNAPDNVLATAFGKNDFRMFSPKNAGPDSSMLMKGVTHEFTHCVHLNIDYSPNNPRWLWEGVAMFEAEWFFDPKEIDDIKTKHFPPLASLNNGLEYMLGYVIIEAIQDNWGFDAVVNLIKKRGDTQAVLKINEKQFEEQIFAHIYQKYVQN